MSRPSPILNLSARAVCVFSALVFIGLFARPSIAQELGVRLSADSVTVGERFRLTVIAAHEFAAVPTFPPPDSVGTRVFGDVEVLSLISRGSRTSNGRRIDSVEYEVTTFALDTARVGPIPVLFTAGEDTFTVRTDPVLLPVTSLVTEEAQELRDLAPLVEFPSPLWPYAAAAVAALIAALLAVYLYKRRKRDAVLPPASPPVEPDVEAFERLERLDSVDLQEDANVQPFYDELSGILRTYASRRLGVSALEMTTGELVQALLLRDVPAEKAEAERVPDRETTERLRKVLVVSDYVKFADARPSAEQGKKLIAASRGVIQAVEAQLTPPAEERAHADSLQ